MSKRAKTVDHLGKVQETGTANVLVSILSHSACSACHAKTACGLSDSEEKIIAIHKPNHNLSVGQDVKVILKQTLGFKALFLGYVLPFFIVLIALIVLTSLSVSEGKAGLLSLFTLFPYYIGLYLLRDRVSKQFTFDIEPV